MKQWRLHSLLANDLAGHWAVVLVSGALVIFEVILPNRGSPEYNGFDLARYQTRGAYVPASAAELLSRDEARQHWVYYCVVCVPLFVSVAMLVLSHRARGKKGQVGLRRTLNVMSGIIGIGTFVLLTWMLFTAKFPRISWTIGPPPILVVQSFGRYYQTSENSSGLLSELVPCAARTSFSLLLAILIATSLGLGLGLALGHLRTLSAWISPYVYIISPLPPIVLYPVVNALTLPNSVQQFLGIHVDDPDRWLSIIRDLSLTIWAVFWPIFAAALDGSRLVNPRLLAVAQSLGAGRWRRLWKIVLPQSIGAILTNFRLGVIMGMIVLLFAQGKGGEPRNPHGLLTLFVPGLGGKLAVLEEEQNLAPLLACVATVVAVVLLFDLGRLSLQFLLFPWLHLRPERKDSAEIIDVWRTECSIEAIADHLRLFLPTPKQIADPIVVIRDLQVQFGLFKLKIPTLEISRAEIVSIIGKSASGKTSLVEVICGMGLHTSLTGSVIVNGNQIYDERGARSERVRDVGIGFVHQDYGLFAHLTVRKNLDFAIDLKRNAWNADLRERSKNLEPEIRRQLLEFLGLSSDAQILRKYPSQLSGGQRQRVAIARALLTAEPLLVLDEGLNSIDQPTRAIIRDGLCDLVHKLGLTLIAISHDNQDVLQISDRILYVEKRRDNSSTIVADASPRDFYYTPISAEAARFIGHQNIFRIDDGPEIPNGKWLLRADASNGSSIEVSKEKIPLERRGDLLVIPASWVNPSWNLEHPTFRGVIRTERFAGPHHELIIECEGGFLLSAIVQDDDYVLLAEQLSGHKEEKIPRLKGEQVDLGIGHSVPKAQ